VFLFWFKTALLLTDNSIITDILNGAILVAVNIRMNHFLSWKCVLPFSSIGRWSYSFMKS